MNLKHIYGARSYSILLQLHMLFSLECCIYKNQQYVGEKKCVGGNYFNFTFKTTVFSQLNYFQLLLYINIVPT
jgi:hypothetical protein